MSYKRYKLSDIVYNLKQRGDISAIGKKSGINYQNIAYAFQKGDCTKKIFDAINSFYNIKNNGNS